MKIEDVGEEEDSLDSVEGLEILVQQMDWREEQGLVCDNKATGNENNLGSFGGGIRVFEIRGFGIWGCLWDWTVAILNPVAKNGLRISL